MYSMTGFARSQHSADWGSVTWELRSVNHRYLDVSLRIPEGLRALENPIRERLRQQLGRGKVEVSLRFQPGPALENEIRIDEAIVGQLAQAKETLRSHFSESLSLDLLRILQWPGVIEEDAQRFERAHQPIMESLDEAIDKLKIARGREGETIKALMTDKLDQIQTNVQTVRNDYPKILLAVKQKVLDKLSDVTEKLDADRLEQEMVYFAQRVDVAEELDRLDAHVNEIQKILERDDQMGRRLDFFMQELNREANTLASKSQSTAQTHASVDMKVLIEQMREQVQNIE